MNRKLLYVTTVNINDSSAQSLQIQSMSSAFYEANNANFMLYAFTNSEEVKQFYYPSRLIFSCGSKLVRTINVFCNIFFSDEKNYAIFTRDLYLALLFIFIGKDVVWEAHQQTSRLAKIVMSFLNLFSSFKVLTISDALRVSGEITINEDKIFSYHDGCHFERDEKIDDLKFDRKTALYTGALHKGRDIESLEPLFREFPEWDFLFIGGSEMDVIRYRKMYAHYENVTFNGRLNHTEIMKYQKSSDVLLFPLTKSNKLWRYTSPLKLFEYMKSGTPIIGSNIGSVSEVIDKGNAFIFSGEDGVINAFNEFLASSESELKNKAYENLGLIKNKYSWKIRADFILNNIYSK